MADGMPEQEASMMTGWSVNSVRLQMLTDKPSFVTI